MHYMLCKQSIKDFAGFKEVLASHDPAHRESGFHVQQVWRNIDDPRQAFFVCEVWDVAKAKAFVKSETERLKRSGVTKFPDIAYLSED
jgi:hypothetical protein